MNKGTIFRTVLAIAIAINSANVMAAFAEFDNPIVNTVYKIVSLIALIIVIAANTYFNNDYTIEGEVGTITTREMKKHREAVADYNEDEVIFDDYDE